MYKKINEVYFSATGTTKKLVSAVANGIGIEEKSIYNISWGTPHSTSIPDNEIVIFGVPVFSGRVPAIAIEALNKFTGNNTPAIILCVYGNRDFEDALLELNNLVKHNGFIVISAGAFIGQHSIFPKVGEARPDATDLEMAEDFGRESMKWLLDKKQSEVRPDIKIKGNFPYREIKKIPLQPKANKKCNICGLCAKECPSQAISYETPCKTDKSRCMACAHCIYICPSHARHFSGLLYRFARHKFVRAYAERKEPYIIYR